MIDISLSKEQKKALIKKYKQEERDRQFAGITTFMSLEQLQALVDYVDEQLTDQDCDHSLRYTMMWLEDHGFKRIDEIMTELEKLGGYCDCEVASNIEVPK